MKVPDVHESDVELLEKEIDNMQDALPGLKTFVLPGGNAVNSICHITRCVCRRSERLTVQLNETEQVEPLLLKYLNRLSDYLFVLARKISFDTKSEEVPWKPRL
jgi:cob(I)alamin adenosyltransferase